MTDQALAVTAADVDAASARISDAIITTPTTASLTLSAITGADVVVKFENLQFTASFKERGALNRLLQLDDAERAHGVITASAGNHGQGLAHHARRLGVRATVVMPETTPYVKVSRVAALGARIVQQGQSLTEARRAAQELAERDGLIVVPPYNDAAVIAGQGTVALEMLAAHPDLEVLVVPCGGGGLLAGMAVAARDKAPGIELVGVQAAGCASMVAARAGTAPPATCSTIADGIAVPEAGGLTVPIIRSLVDDVVTVTEAHLEEAVSLYLEIEKVVAEPAGAAALAALLEHRERFAGRRVGLVLSGGNIDPRVLASVIVRSLARSGRLTRLVVELPDRAGSLASLTAVVAAGGANIIEVVHRRDVPTLELREARVEMTIETRDRAHADEIVQAIRTDGFDVAVERLLA